MSGPEDGTERAGVHVWHALQVRSNHERGVAEDLRRAGFEAFLPVTVIESRWTDRVKRIERPLFPGYVFARSGDCPPGWIRGVLRIVGEVPDREIAAVRQVIDSRLAVETWPWSAGELVEIDSGAFAGQRGRIIRVRDKVRIVISIELLRRAVAVEVGAEFIKRAGSGEDKEEKGRLETRRISGGVSTNRERNESRESGAHRTRPPLPLA